jgi:CBS domain-containing protein
MSATVRDIMTARVVAVREDARFKEMAAMLCSSRISAFPVVDHEGRVIGVVSEADLLANQADQDGPQGWLDGVLRHREHEKAAGVTAGELMTSPPVTIGPDVPAQEAARLMYDRRVKRLPVVNGTGHLIGIVSRVDVLAVFSRPDGEIRNEITGDLILERFLVDPQALEVAVRDGIVTIAGEPETDEVGRQIVAAIRHVEGVVAVRDRLRYSGDRRPMTEPA